MYGNSAGNASMLKKRNLSLCLSAKEKQLPQSEFRFPGEPILPRGIYDRTIILPPGIRNEGNLCYAISVVQCLFNHSTFRDSLADVPFMKKMDNVKCAFKKVWCYQARMK